MVDTNGRESNEERTLELDLERRRVCISFPYDASLVDLVRSLPDRQWDWSDKTWYVPLEHIGEVVARLAPLDFALGGALADWIDEESGGVDALVADGADKWRPLIPESLLPEGTYTVASINHAVRDAIHRAFPEQVWVAAEIQGFDRNKSGGHAFFELLERPYEGADPTARLQAVMFREVRRSIEAELRESGGEVRLRDGLVVRFGGTIDLYTGHGRYQLVISELDTTFTAGAIEQNRDAVLRHLERAGILEQNLALPWPICPLRVGLITSYDSDAYNDFIDELERSGYGFDVTMVHANVQGASTESSVLRALDYFAGRADDFDAVAIVRGGGAKTDLAYFDTDAIGEAVCRHPVKILCGVGHHRDQSLLDFIGHSEKTPTAAGRELVRRVDDYREASRERFRQIMRAADARLDRARERIERRSARFERAALTQLDHRRRELDRMGHRLTETSRDRVHRARRRLDRASYRIAPAARARLDRSRQQLDYLQREIGPQRMARRFDERRDDLAALTERLADAARRAIDDERDELGHRAARLRLLDPRRVLERGFAIARRDGIAVRDPADVAAGESLEIQVAGGRLEAEVTGAHSEDRERIDDTPQGEEGGAP
jgi:exodeoxyribonuclease VII large subunit